MDVIHLPHNENTLNVNITYFKFLDSENDYESAVENSIALSPHKDLCAQFGNIGLNEKPETINEASETSAADQTFELKSEHGSSSIIEQNDEEAKDFSSIESNNDTSKEGRS